MVLQTVLLFGLLPPPPHAMQQGGQTTEGDMYSFTLSLTSAKMGLGGQRTTRAALPQRKTHCIGGWVGPTSGQEGYGKISPPTELLYKTVQPVASRYTD
jgi:hypothetical protein